MPKGKQEVISFKADEALLQAMQGIPNRSQFIRAAVLSALNGVCPLCRGTGILTPAQQDHWKSFAQAHAVTQCGQCHALHLVCRGLPGAGQAHGRAE